jgi:hypothetical protein
LISYEADTAYEADKADSAYEAVKAKLDVIGYKDPDRNCPGLNCLIMPISL